MNQLYHYGKKGMKWGVRREQARIARSIGATRQDVAAAMKNKSAAASLRKTSAAIRTEKKNRSIFTGEASVKGAELRNKGLQTIAKNLNRSPESIRNRGRLSMGLKIVGASLAINTAIGLASAKRIR